MKTKSYTRNISEISGRIMNIRKQNLSNRFNDFINTPFRMEKVRILNEVIFINDSKAENINATYFALKTIKKPIVWIVGGDDARTNYWELMKLVREKVTTIIMIGKHNDNLIHTFSPVIKNIFKADDMNEAVKLAYQNSESKTTILLSAGAKPDELYVDFEDRGKQFNKAVINI